MASDNVPGRAYGESSKGGSSPTSPAGVIPFRLLAALTAAGLLILLTVSCLSNRTRGSLSSSPREPQRSLTSALRASIHTLQTSTAAGISRLRALPHTLFDARWQKSRLTEGSPLEDAPGTLSSSSLSSHWSSFQGPSLASEATSEERATRLLTSAVAPKRRMLRRRFENFSTGISSLFTHHVVSELLSGADVEPGKNFYNIIPGSKLELPEEVAGVRATLRCFGAAGRWVFHPQPRPLAWPVDGPELCDKNWRAVGGMAGPGANKVRMAENWNVHPRLKYTWDVNATCGEWKNFSKAGFCGAVNRLGGKVMIVGDSVMRNMFQNLHNHLHLAQPGGHHLHTPRLCEHWKKQGRLPEDKYPCLCKGLGNYCRHSIVRVRNDRLTLLNRSPYWESVDGLEIFLPWFRLIKRWNVKAVLLNRGAHFAPSAEFAEELKLTMLVLRRTYPDLLIMFRATPPGHKNCFKYKGPTARPQDTEGLPYGWGLFHEQNKIAQSIVESFGGVFLDVDTMTSIRPDGHYRKTDCLHYCNPGPIDAWVKLFYNALIRLV